MTVADLLAASRAQHARYRDHSPRMVPQGGVMVRWDGDPAIAAAALWQACRLRTEAHALDPQQTDPAWQMESPTHPHDDLLTFYADQLSR